MERGQKVSTLSFLRCIPNSLSRLDVGGKLLTNQLKELVSFRQWNMMDETYIMNDVKESCCYVSLNFKNDLETCRYASTSRKDVVLSHSNNRTAD